MITYLAEMECSPRPMTFRPMPVAPPKAQTIPIVQPNPTDNYNLISVNGYDYLIPANLDANGAVSTLGHNNYVAALKKPVSGTDLRAFDRTIPIASAHDIFTVDHFFYLGTSIVRRSSQLDQMLLSGNIVQTSPAQTVQTSTESNQKVKVSEDGNWVITDNKKIVMFVSWDGERFMAFKDRKNDDDLKVEGRVEKNKFVCKYGDINII